MAEIFSNQFTTTINRSTTPSISADDLSTTVNIYKKGVLLTAVKGTPTTNQYQVKITEDIGCIAAVQDDNKTIKLLAVTSNAGKVDVSINIENKETYVKSIPIGSITGTQVINTAMSEVKQTANKISWLVKSGTNSSNMQLTDQLFNLVSNNITLTASHINLNGYVSNNDANWSIDNEGNMIAENLKVEGDIPADSLSVNYIDNPSYPATLAGTVRLYVNADTGSDDYTLDNILQSYDLAEENSNDGLRKKFKTIQGALDACPAFLNNKEVKITLETDVVGDVYIKSFTGGAIRLYLNGKIVYGHIRGYGTTATIHIVGGVEGDTTRSQAIIHPSVGYGIGSRCVSVGFEACQFVTLYKLKVFGADNHADNLAGVPKVAVASCGGTGSVYCSGVEVTNCAVGFRTNNMGNLHGSSTSGKASQYGFESVTGGQISLANNAQTGGSTANTHTSSGGQIWSGSSTFTTGDVSQSGDSAPVVSRDKTMTIKSTYGDTYRSSVYNNWKKDGTARQGDYGYGDCTGCWFFGTAFAELRGCNIKKVELTITRQSGGSYSAVGLVVRTHNYSARPSGAPTLSSSSYGTLSLATGKTGTLTITNADVLNGIKNGTIKGFGIRTTYDKTHYAVCSGSVTVKITYTE